MVSGVRVTDCNCSVNTKYIKLRSFATLQRSSACKYWKWIRICSQVNPILQVAFESFFLFYFSFVWFSVSFRSSQSATLNKHTEHSQIQSERNERRMKSRRKRRKKKIRNKTKWKMCSNDGQKRLKANGPNENAMKSREERECEQDTKLQILLRILYACIVKRLQTRTVCPSTPFTPSIACRMESSGSRDESPYWVRAKCTQVQVKVMYVWSPVVSISINCRKTDRARDGEKDRGLRGR